MFIFVKLNHFNGYEFINGNSDNFLKEIVVFIGIYIIILVKFIIKILVYYFHFKFIE